MKIMGLGASCLSAVGRGDRELNLVIPERRESLTVGLKPGSPVLAAVIRRRNDLRQTPAELCGGFAEEGNGNLLFVGRPNASSGWKARTQFIRPANLPPAGATRPLPPRQKVRSSGALVHPGGRATLSTSPEPARSRLALVSGGLRARRGIFPVVVVESDRSLVSTLLRQSPNYAAQHFAELLGSASPFVCGLLHARKVRSVHEQPVGKNAQGVVGDYS